MLERPNPILKFSPSIKAVQIASCPDEDLTVWQTIYHKTSKLMDSREF